MSTLTTLLAANPRSIHEIAEELDRLMQIAVETVNREWLPVRMAKQGRDVEPLPVIAQNLSDYRTRMGMMLEYSVSDELARVLKDVCGDQYLVTFVWYNVYPDFIIRDRTLNPVLRLEMKTIDAYSEEQAARFETLPSEIEEETDLVGFLGWCDTPCLYDGVVVGEMPSVFTSIVVPACELAAERDRRLTICGGKIENGEVLVPKRDGSGYTKDPGNFGKLWRIVHTSRREADDLSDSITRYMAFLEDVRSRGAS